MASGLQGKPPNVLYIQTCSTLIWTPNLVNCNFWKKKKFQLYICFNFWSLTRSGSAIRKNAGSRSALNQCVSTTLLILNIKPYSTLVLNIQHVSALILFCSRVVVLFSRACSTYSIFSAFLSCIKLLLVKAVGEEREWSGTRERVWPSSLPGPRTGRAGFHTNLLNRVNYKSPNL